MNKIIPDNTTSQSAAGKPLTRILLAFAFVALLDLAGLAMGAEGLLLHRVMKSLLMPVLMLLVWRSGPAVPQRGWLFAALIASWLGDLLLMLPGSQFFLMGLGSFFLAHLFYLGVFQLRNQLLSGPLRSKPWVVLPFFAFAGALLLLLWPGIPAGMRLPVSAYAGVISLMAFAAWGKSRELSAPWAALLMAGALLFLLSDSLIALGKFGQDLLRIPAQAVMVMLTYSLAQGCIVWSWVNGAQKTV